jgi:toxin-antitoxin system PIN domain toxin
VIAVDTNVLVYAHRRESEFHSFCRSKLKELAEGLDPWTIPIFCLGEFIRIATHTKVFDPPSKLKQVLENIDSLLESPSLEILLPGEKFWDFFKREIIETNCKGNLVFDAQIAALCKEHGVNEILTFDQDFKRFDKIKVISPGV